MHYDLDSLEQFAVELGFFTEREGPDLLLVRLEPGLNLCFSNCIDSNGKKDSLIGFKGLPWHAHNKLILMVGDGQFVELGELEILEEIKKGRVLLVEQIVAGERVDCWLHHEKESTESKSMELNEELKIHRLA